MKKTLVLAVILAATSPVQAKGVRASAEAEYQACFKQTARARRDCSFGGCGNILAACYERQIAVFQNDSSRRAELIASGPCAASAAKAAEAFHALEERLLKIPQFDNTWSGFALRVELAATQNQSLALLASECLPAGKIPNER